jgi:hypothetical protein
VERQGYLAHRSDGNVAQWMVTQVQLGSPDQIPAFQGTTRQVKITLRAGGILSGKAVNAAGRPVAGLSLSAVRWSYSNGQRLLRDAHAVSGTPNATTDDLGEFRIFWLPPGEYYLRIGKEPSGRRQEYSPDLYFPGTPDVNLATRLVVKEGQETGGLRVTVPERVGFRISGAVINTIAGAVPYKIMVAPDAPPFDHEWIDAFLPDPDKNDAESPFEIVGVPPGSYVLDALFRVKESDSEESNHIARTKVTVGTEDLPGVLMTVQRSSDIRGKVSLSSEAQSFFRNQRGGRFQMELQFAEYSTDMSRRTLNADANEDEGRMTFSATHLLQGRYRISWLPLPPDAYLADIKQDGQSVYDDNIFSIGGKTTELDILVGRNGGAIQGSVVLGPAAIVSPTIAVVLAPEASRRRNLLLYKRQDIGSAPADPSLYRFNFTGISPGNYKIFAFEFLERGSEFNADVLAPYESRGTLISVAAGVTRDLQIPLIRGN